MKESRASRRAFRLVSRRAERMRLPASGAGRVDPLSEARYRPRVSPKPSGPSWWPPSVRYPDKCDVLPPSSCGSSRKSMRDKPCRTSRSACLNFPASSERRPSDRVDPQMASFDRDRRRWPCPEAGSFIRKPLTLRREAGSQDLRSCQLVVIPPVVGAFCLKESPSSLTEIGRDAAGVSEIGPSEGTCVLHERHSVGSVVQPVRDFHSNSAA